MVKNTLYYGIIVQMLIDNLLYFGNMITLLSIVALVIIIAV
jgi:hypothetical protein